MLDLRQEREIFSHDRDKEPILTADNYVENAHLAVGFGSRCWDEDGVFDTGKALRLGNELCAYMRLLSEGGAK